MGPSGAHPHRAPVVRAGGSCRGSPAAGAPPVTSTGGTTTRSAPRGCGHAGTDEHTRHTHDDWRRGAVARPAGAAARGRPRPARAGAVAALGGVAAVGP